MRKIIEEIFKSGVNIVGFGESEHGTHEVVFEKFGELNGLFDGMFLEDPVDYQDSVDAYLKTQKFDKNFEDLIIGSLEENKDVKRTIRLLLDYAVANNIPVVCIDSSKTKDKRYAKELTHSYSFAQTDSRDGDMYLNITKTITEKGGRWCLVGGAAHLDYNFDFDEGYPSLAKRLKKEMGKKLFTIGLFKKVDSKFEFLLSSQLGNVELPFPGDITKSFDAVILHP